MTALTEALKAAIEARLQVARAAAEWVDGVDHGWPEVVAPEVSFNGPDPIELHCIEHSPDVVARSCEADLELLDYCDRGWSFPCDVVIRTVLDNLNVRYGVSDD